MGSGFSWSKILGQQVPQPLNTEEAEAPESSAQDEAAESADEASARKWKGFSFEVEANDDSFSMNKAPSLKAQTGEPEVPDSDEPVSQDDAVAARIAHMQEMARQNDAEQAVEDDSLAAKSWDSTDDIAEPYSSDPPAWSEKSDEPEPVPVFINDPEEELTDLKAVEVSIEPAADANSDLASEWDIEEPAAEAEPELEAEAEVEDPAAEAEPEFEAEAEAEVEEPAAEVESEIEEEAEVEDPAAEVEPELEPEAEVEDPAAEAEPELEAEAEVEEPAAEAEPELEAEAEVEEPAAEAEPELEAEVEVEEPAAEAEPELEAEVEVEEPAAEAEPEFEAEAEVEEPAAEAEPELEAEVEVEEPAAEAEPEIEAEAEFEAEAEAEEPAAEAEPEIEAEAEAEEPAAEAEPEIEAEAEVEEPAAEAEPELEAEVEEPAAEAEPEIEAEAEVEEPAAEAEPEIEAEVEEPAAEAEPEIEAEAEVEEPAAAAKPFSNIPDVFRQSLESQMPSPLAAEKLRASGSPDFGAMLAATSFDMPMNEQPNPAATSIPAADNHEMPIPFQDFEEPTPAKKSPYIPEEVPQSVHSIDVSDKRFDDPHAGEHFEGDSDGTGEDVIPIKDCHIDDILRYAVEHKASDIHLTGGLPPVMRLDGEIVHMPFTRLSDKDTRRLIFDTLTDEHIEKVETTHELDFAYTVKGVSRFRFNVYVQRGGIAGALRAIPSKIPSFETLGLPPVIRDLSKRTSGLILVTGPTGSGKSTTIASMIDDINDTRTNHIVTIEDPIEYLHRHKKCMVNQRELHSDTYSLHNALRAVLREDPDVILIGELRDLETIEAALTLAETGHLVFGTLHTRNAPSTIDRVVDVFPSDQQAQIRVLLGNTLEGVISQQLLPRLGGGRSAALEIMVATPGIKNMIREGKTHQMYSSIETGGQMGMQTMDSSLANFFRMGYCSYEECLMRSVDKENFARLAKSAA